MSAVHGRLGYEITCCVLTWDIILSTHSDILTCTLTLSVYILSQNGNTSLHVAAAEGHLDIVRYLLSNGLDANLQNKVCCTNISAVFDLYR